MNFASKFTGGFLAAACVAMVSAEEKEVLKIEKPADFQKAESVSQAENAVVLKGKGIFLSKPTLSVNPAAKYRISGEFRLKSGKPAGVWLGFCPYDVKKNRIYPSTINGSNETRTELAAAAKKGDKVLKLKDASKWDTKTRYSYIAFKAAEDYSDLPNFQINKTAVPNAVKKGDVWEIPLVNPLKVDYPAGTAVRQHTDNAAFIYTCRKFKTTDKWAQPSGNISGIAVNEVTTQKFWKGTVTASIVILLTDADPQSETEIRNVKVVEIK